MATLDEATLVRQAQAIQTLERLGNNEDRNRGAQARQALDSFVGQAVNAGHRFSQGVLDTFQQVGIKGGQAFDAAEDAISAVAQQGPAAVLNALGPNGVVNDAFQSVGDTLGGFFNPDSALASSALPVDPQLQAQIDRVNASDPLATSVPAPVITESGAPTPHRVAPPQVAPSLTVGGAGGQTATGVAAPDPNQAMLDQMTQRYLDLGQQVNQGQVDQIQNVIDLDALNRAQTAAALVTSPQLQFSPSQMLGNANLASEGVPSTISQSVGAFQQLSPSASIDSVQPAINASASQSRSVNAVEQSAEADRIKAIQDAQKLSLLKRQAFIDQVVIPRLSQPR